MRIGAQKTQYMKILIAAGGTGGHVFPATCVALELQKRGAEVVFATDVRGERYLKEFAKGAIIQEISTSSRGRLYFSLLRQTVKSFSYLLKNDFDAILGFGGYPSVPFVLAGQLLFKKTFIHEQNAVIGKANKLLSHFAKKIFVSFPKTKNLNNSSKVVFVGMPTRFENEYDKESVKNKKFTILVFGGSQGAKIFSENIAKIICSLKKDLMVYNQVPENFKESTKKIYEAHGIECVVESFFENIDELYRQADLVVSRSGASSIFEIIGFKKNSILVPYKMSINGDQEANAKFLSSNDAAVVIQEQEIEQKLAEVVQKFVESPDEFKIIQENLDKLYKQNITKMFANELKENLKK